MGKRGAENMHYALLEWFFITPLRILGRLRNSSSEFPMHTWQALTLVRSWHRASTVNKNMNRAGNGCVHVNYTLVQSVWNTLNYCAVVWNHYLPTTHTVQVKSDTLNITWTDVFYSSYKKTACRRPSFDPSLHSVHLMQHQMINNTKVYMYNTIVGNALRFVYIHLDHNTSVVGASIFWYSTETPRTKLSTISYWDIKCRSPFQAPVVSRNSLYCIASTFYVLIFHSSALKMSRDEVKQAPESFIKRNSVHAQLPKIMPVQPPNLLAQHGIASSHWIVSLYHVQNNGYNMV